MAWKQILIRGHDGACDGAIAIPIELFRVLDEVVGRDDPVRVIDAFVEGLDLENWIFQGRRGRTGRRLTRLAIF